MKIKVTVCYPVIVDLEFDGRKDMNETYLSGKREEAKKLADKIFNVSTIKSVIVDADNISLIEG